MSIGKNGDRVLLAYVGWLLLLTAVCTPLNALTIVIIKVLNLYWDWALASRRTRVAPLSL